MQSTNRDFTVNIRVNFNEEIYGSAESFYHFISDNFDKRFTMYFEEIKKLGGEGDAHMEVLNTSSAAFLSLDINKIIKQYNLANAWLTQNTLPCSRICYAAKQNHFVIDYNGAVKKCTWGLDEACNCIGHLDNEGNLNIDDRKCAQWVSQGFENYEECQECRLLPLCYGKKCVYGMVSKNGFSCRHELEELKLEETLKTV